MRFFSISHFLEKNEFLFFSKRPTSLPDKFSDEIRKRRPSYRSQPITVNKVCLNTRILIVLCCSMSVFILQSQLNRREESPKNLLLRL